MAGMITGPDSGGGPAGAPATGPAWVRVRLRAAPGAALAVFALVLVTAFLAVALPRAVDRYEDDALRSAVAGTTPGQRGLDLTAWYTPVEAGGPEDQLGPVSVDAVDGIFHDLVRPPLRVLPGVHGVRTGAASPVPDPEIPRTSSHDPSADLVAQAGLASHVRLVSGRMPPPVPGDRPSLGLGAVITEQTAKVLHMRIGQSVHLRTGSATALTVTVSGIVAPTDATSLFWTQDSDLLAPVVSAPPTPPGSEPKTYWHFTLLTDRTAAPSFPQVGVGATLYWHYPLDSASLTAHELPALRRELASFDSGPDGAALDEAARFPLSVNVGTGPLLDSYVADRDATSPLVLVAFVGVATAGLAVLLMAGGLGAERRRVEIALLRSRGGSLAGIVRRLVGETAAAALPAGALGTALGLALLPTQRWERPVVQGAVVTAVAVLVLPLRAARAARRPRPTGREDLAAARPSRRRLVLELTVAVLAAGAVTALRQRGTTAGSDPFLAAAPVLVAVVAALVLLRVHPLPLRLLARPAARLSGAVTHLGLARAGRSPSTGQLPLLAVLVSLTLASFGGSVLAGVDHGRDEVATVRVGADARVDARFALTPQLIGQVKKLAGVGQVITVRVEPNSPDPVFDRPYELVAVDPEAYARFTRSIGLPPFPAAALSGPAGTGPLPAVLSPYLAASLGDRSAPVATGVGSAEIRTAGVLTSTPAIADIDFVIVSAAQLAARHPDTAAFSQYTEPTTLLAMDAPGRSIDGRALRDLTRERNGLVTVQLRSERRAALNGSPLQRGARTVYLSAVAAGAGYSLLALLLSLLQAAPQRAALLARLRTMGMTRRQSRRLVLLEMLPQTLLAAVGGVLVGLAVIPLLGPGVDLRALALGTGQQDLAPAGLELGLRADPWSLALPSGGLLVLACAVLLAQVWLSARRRESTELRVGDRT